MTRELSERRAQLTAQELEALRARLSGGAQRRPGIGIGIGRRPEGSAPVLSYAQRRLWFLDQFEPDSDGYNIGLGLRLRGDLDAGVLRRALDGVVERHQTLRTSFGSKRGEPVLRVHEHVEVPWEVADLAHLPAAERETEARRLADDLAARPFDLSQAPLLRALLVRLAEHQHVLVLSFHHIVTDGWSQGVLARELSELYAAQVEGRPARLAELAMQYEDYAHWQRECLSGAELERQLGYWRERLAGLEPLELPGDHARPAVRSPRGGSHELRLDAELTGRLRELGRGTGTTLHQVLMAGLFVLLWRYTGQADLSVGTVTAGRSRREVEELVGFFENTLVIRSRLRGEDSFERVLTGVREALLEAHAHEDVPFEKLVDELRVERDPSRTPLFQVLCVLQNAPEGDLVLPGVKVDDYELASSAAKCDLILELQEGPAAGLVGEIVYSVDLFEAETVERMAGHLEVLLRGIAAGPEKPVRDLPLLSPAERDQLRRWADTACPFPHDILRMGRPLANTRVYVLDQEGQQVPVGVPGELHIGGEGLAREYMVQPRQTAERFVPDALGGRGGRLYRTGELVRWLSDGSLGFLGRVDDQVKIRGHRVIPAEVEEMLAQHPAVQRTMVLVRADPLGHKQLVAYVVAEASAAELREHLQERLPEYMVPSAWVLMVELPLQSNEKVDRQRLPDPEWEAEWAEYEAPRDEVETALAEVWAEVLRTERVGVHDNFFELGGDSILSIQVVARAAERGLRLTSRQLFQEQTVAGLGRVVERTNFDTVQPLDEHDRARQALLDDVAWPGLEGHLAVCPICRTLAAKLARLDAMIPPIPPPRRGLLAEVMLTTRGIPEPRRGLLEDLQRARRADPSA